MGVVAINSVSFQAEYESSTTTYLRANIGNGVTVEIQGTYTRDNPLDAFPSVARLGYSLIEKSVNPYASSPVGTFYPPVDVSYQGSTAPTSEWYSQAPRNETSGEAFGGGNFARVLVDSWVEVGDVATFTLRHTFLLEPEIQQANILTGNNISIPSYFSGGNCLKYVFLIEFSNGLDGGTFNNDLSGLDTFHMGDTGFLGEVYNGGAKDWTLLSMSGTQVNSLADTVFFGQIQCTQPVAGSKLRLLIGKQPNELNPAESIQRNQDIQRLTRTVGDPPFSAFYIQDLDITENVGDNTIVDFEFTVLANSFTTLEAVYAWFQVWNPLLAPKQENVFLFATYVGEEPSTGDVILLAPSGSTTGFDDFHFLKWWTFNTAYAHNQCFAFRADDQLAKWRVRNDNAGISIDSITVQIKDRVSGNVIDSESYTFAVQSIASPFVIDRPIQRNAGNLHKYITVERLSVDEFEFTFGFQIWRNWIQNNIVLACIVNGFQGSAVFQKEFQSTDFRLGQFFETQNTVFEPQMLPRTSDLDLEFYVVDAVGNITIPTPFANPIAGEDNLVVAYWEDNNLNDMNTTESDLCGYLGVNIEGDSKGSWRPIFTEYDCETSSPWDAPLAHTANRAKVTKIDLKTAKVEAIVRWNRLEAIYGSAINSSGKLCFTARLDKKDVPFKVLIAYGCDGLSGGDVTFENVTQGIGLSGIGGYNNANVGDTIRVYLDLQNEVLLRLLDFKINGVSTPWTSVVTAGDLGLTNISGYIEFTYTEPVFVELCVRWAKHSTYDSEFVVNDGSGFASEITDMVWNLSAVNPYANNLGQSEPTGRPKIETGYLLFSGQERLTRGGYSFVGDYPYCFWVGEAEQSIDPLQMNDTTSRDNMYACFDFGQGWLNINENRSATDSGRFFGYIKKQRNNDISKTHHVSFVNYTTPAYSPNQILMFEAGQANNSQTGKPFGASGTYTFYIYQAGGGLLKTGNLRYATEVTYGYPVPVLTSQATIGDINATTEQWIQSGLYFYGGKYKGKFHSLFICAEEFRTVEKDAVRAFFSARYL